MRPAPSENEEEMRCGECLRLAMESLCEECRAAQEAVVRAVQVRYGYTQSGIGEAAVKALRDAGFTVERKQIATVRGPDGEDTGIPVYFERVEPTDAEVAQIAEANALRPATRDDSKALADAMLRIIAQVQEALGITEEDAACANGAEEMLDAIEGLKAAAQRTATAQQEAVAVGPMDLSAPAKIWLQVDPNGDEDDRSEPIKYVDEMTWCAESVGGQEIAYIRADLAAPPAAPGVPEGWKLVPVEPTDLMFKAALRLQGEDAAVAAAPALLSALLKIYRAMLAASPSAPGETP